MLGVWFRSYPKACAMPRRRTPGRPVELERDYARPRTVPAPTTPQMDAQLQLLLYPAVFGLRDRYRGMGYRERILSLPVMVGILLSLVWRQIASVSELQRVLAREQLLWVEPTKITQQALSARLAALPAELFAPLWHELVSRCCSSGRRSVPRRIRPCWRGGTGLRPRLGAG